MGVRRLQSWVEEHSAEVCNFTSIPRGSVLLVDGAGLCFYVLALQVESRCGNYATLDAALSSFCTNLKRAGMRLVVYLDGPSTRLKSSTFRSRRAERAERMEQLQAICMDGRVVEPSQLPEPPLMLSQLVSSVAACRIPIHQCAGEADPELAWDCHRGGVDHWILVDDSDFYLYRGVRYVRFQAIQLAEEGGRGELWPMHRLVPPTVQLFALGLCWTRELLMEVPLRIGISSLTSLHQFLSV